MFMHFFLCLLLITGEKIIMEVNMMLHRNSQIKFTCLICLINKNNFREAAKNTFE